MSGPATPGARRTGSSAWEFALWAPSPERVALVIDGRSDGEHELDRDEHGWARITLDGLEHGTRYHYVIDGRQRPDPASRWQPDGVHGPSALVDPDRFSWSDGAWVGLSGLGGQVLYELHVGTFSPTGTFDGAIEHLDALAELGVTTIELMPVAQFPGARNWGYDGVLPSAAQDTYGGPEGLARLVDAAHARGLAVILDVVYNHLGPEGNHLAELGPYFTDAYVTPWGGALNFSEAGSDEVRELFVSSARQWVRDHHVDGFRLDAVHAIVDPTARTFLEELTEAIHDEARTAGRRAVVIAESSASDPRLVRPVAAGGLGMDGVWQDEVHHAIRVAVTGEAPGYYADFTGADDLATALRHNLVYRGRYSRVRGRRHGRPADDVPACVHVVFDQNHDQVGNRAFGERLDVLVDAPRRRVAAAVVALGPFTPMLWMGEEYGETAPFPYFVSHTDPDLLRAVREGRREEFAAFDWTEEPPDPGAVETFASAVLDRTTSDDAVEQLWRDLLATRRDHPVLWDPDATATTTRTGDAVVHHRRRGVAQATVIWNLGPDPVRVPLVGDAHTIVLTTEHPAMRTADVRTAETDVSLPGWSAVVLAVVSDSDRRAPTP